jgi:hypothetical protein
LISAPWDDVEGLFTPGADFLMAQDGSTMTRALRTLLHDPVLAGALAARGRRTIEERHSCAHRVDELIGFGGRLRGTDWGLWLAELYVGAAGAPGLFGDKTQMTRMGR